MIELPARTRATQATQPLPGFLGQVKRDMYALVVEPTKNENSPRVSVIVPTRNRRDLLRSTIEGLLTQDLPSDDLEIIVVDNASDDGTSELCLEMGRRSEVPFTFVRMHYDNGPATGRNVGVTLASGTYLAFTDSDCVPTRAWLRAMLASIADETGVVQGRTLAHPEQRQPLFNHFIETKRFDGSFSTSNVCYRRDAVVAAGGFDPSCVYWEDVDLGWRVRRLGWEATFAREGLVYHQVLPLSAWQWVTRPRHFYNWPAKARRYPEFRRHLFLGVWADRKNVLFDLLLAGVAVAPWRPRGLLLTLPYILSFAMTRRPVGRYPALKVLAHLAYDCVGFVSLVAGSIRFRRAVL